MTALDVQVIAKLLGVTNQSITDMLTSTPHISGNRSIMMNPLSYDKVHFSGTFYHKAWFDFFIINWAVNYKR